MVFQFDATIQHIKVDPIRSLIVALCRFLHIVAILQQKEAQTMPYFYRMTNGYSAQYYRQYCTPQAFEQFNDKNDNPTRLGFKPRFLLSFKPQSDRLSHLGQAMDM